MLAFETGLRAGADGLECDVRLSRDGVPVVIHDATLDRTTAGAGPVHAYTASELARMDAAWHFVVDGQTPWRGRGVGIPALADVLARHRDCRLIIEMKDDLPELGYAVAALLRREPSLERICAAGFGAHPVRALRRELPDVATSAHMAEVRTALYASWAGWRLRGREYGGYQIPEVRGALRVVSRRFVRQAHRAGHRVQVWTVNDEADMRRLLAWGVDAFITDRPDLARATLGAHASGAT